MVLMENVGDLKDSKEINWNNKLRSSHIEIIDDKIHNAR